MTPPPALVDASGRPIPLDRQLGNPGGEGTVFALLNDAAHAVKVYHQPPSAQTVEKLSAMVGLANPQLLSLTAWPMGLVYHARSRQMAGFVMPRMSDCRPIQHLYNPVQRLTYFPRAGWAFQVRAAVNLAAAFDEVHRASCLMGDVNERNELISAQALVRLIDCDSFQVRAKGKQYLCEVGVVHYTPPELQRKSFRGLVRTENHDRFGLAVLIYQLLFAGRHPYMGLHSDEAPFDQLIADFRFAQGPAASSWGMAPPPHTPTFADIPPEVGTLFRRAFERGSEAGTRPRPVEWLSALKQLEQSIVECPADSGHRYWGGARSCVWCRLAEHGGPEYYFGVAGDVAAFAVDEARLQEVLRRINACSPVEFPYDRDRYRPALPPEPEPLRAGVEEHRSTAIVLSVVLGLCVLAMPFGLIRGFICVIGLLGSLIFGVWLAVLLSISPLHREMRRRRLSRNLAADDLKQLEAEWKRTVRRYRHEHSELLRSVSKLITDCRGLESQYHVELKRLTRNAEAIARLRHLRLHLLADADIPKIGAGRKQILASYNVFTAADIEANTILGIKGFGDVLTRALVEWREEVLRAFRFNPATGVSPAEQRTIAAQFRTYQQQILTELDRQLTRLESLAPACRAVIRNLVPQVKNAIAAWEQAEADLRLRPPVS
jgi:DNA-binding helix-hairpin-helix protein with protein kinase domain